MDEGKDRFGEKMKLVERAKENIYFAEKDREAIEKLRAQLAEAQSSENQHMVELIDRALDSKGDTHAHEKVRVRTILVPMDFSDCSSLALDHAEAYYLLGVAESYISRSHWISETEFFLETAIRTNPQSKTARKAYVVLEEYIVLGYSGSSGTHTPADVQKSSKNFACFQV